MTGHLTAGDPLVPNRAPPPNPPTPPPGQRGQDNRRRDRPERETRTPSRKRPPFVFRLFGGLFAAGVGIVVLAGLVGGVIAWQSYRQIAGDLPTVAGLRTYQPPVMSRIYASDDQLIGELATERRIFVPYTAIPDQVKQAFVSAEDKTFWSHRGVDPAAILRAAVTDIQMMGQGRRPIGASTITQQVAKNMLLGSNVVTLSRKIKEAILATRIENTLPKERILELYLNEIYLGLGSYGVAAASQAYFDKPLDQLTLAQAAFLGALPKAPNNYNPFRYPEAAKARRDWVIDRMAEDRYVTAEQAAAAKAEPIAPTAYSRTEIAPGSEWFSDEVRRELIDHYGMQGATEGGLSVRTTLDPTLQGAAEKALRAGLITYDHRHGNWTGPVAHLNDTPALQTGWPTLLAPVGRPAGMLREWRLAVVLDTERGTTARVGYLEPNPGASPTDAGTPRTGLLALGDMGWARHNGMPPRRITDVVKPGDVVMVEPGATTPAAAPSGAAPSGAAPSGAAPSGAAPSGAAPSGAASSGPASASAKPGATSAAPRLQLRQIPHIQGALVAVDPRTGRVLALVGGWSRGASQFDRATQALRQPGSSFKPFVYLTAMERDISPSQRFLDGPFSQDMGAQGIWSPHDFEKGYLGDVPLHIALEKSLNLPTVRLAQQLGMGAVAKTAIAFHEVDSMPKVLPAAIGAVDTTVLRQAGAYAGIAAGGREVIPSLVDTVQDRDGHVIWRNPGLACDGCADPSHPPSILDQRAQIADPASVFQVIMMMEGVVQHGTGYEASKGMNGWQIAGKTGTSQDFNDAWFVGFTPDLVTAVWIGFDQPASLGDNQTGGEVAAPVWREFMQTALRGQTPYPFPQPPGVTVQSWNSGFGQVTDAFKPGQVPGASSGAISGDETATASAADPNAAYEGGGNPDGAPPAPAGIPAPAPAPKLDTGSGGLY